LILAGNKADLNDHRQVSTEEAQEYAKRRNLLFFETSARSGANIKLLFNELAKKLTGIETNPINNIEVKTNGFILGANNGAGADGTGGNEKKKEKKSKCC
jgi:GTPase SAR1 family protein